MPQNVRREPKRLATSPMLIAPMTLDFKWT
jgi:hypothetical protein